MASGSIEVEVTLTNATLEWFKSLALMSKDDAYDALSGWARRAMSDPRRYVYTSTGSTTRKLTEEELNRVAERLRSVSAGFDQASGSVFGGFYGFGKGESVAERAWEQHGGVVACECDDLDCEWILELNKTEYCAASGVGGMYRLTHPQCQVGILGYRLIERGERWLTWNREW